MSVFQNALLTVVWLFTIIMCAELWSPPAIDNNARLAEKQGGIGLFISTAVVAHLFIKHILKTEKKKTDLQQNRQWLMLLFYRAQKMLAIENAFSLIIISQQD